MNSLEPPPSDERRLLGRVEMEVVGVLRDVPLCVFFDAADESERPATRRTIIADRLYVVQSLPVPLHVSHRHLSPPPPFTVDGKFWPTAEAFGEPYRHHPYWCEAASKISSPSLRWWSLLEAVPRPRIPLPTLEYHGDADAELRALRWMLLGVLILGGALVAASSLLSHVVNASAEALGDVWFGDACTAEDETLPWWLEALSPAAAPSDDSTSSARAAWCDEACAMTQGQSEASLHGVDSTYGFRATRE